MYPDSNRSPFEKCTEKSRLPGAEASVNLGSPFGDKMEVALYGKADENLHARRRRRQTSLGDGTRVAKNHLRVAAYGTVDEANSAIGLARLHTAGRDDESLARIQNDLFDIGADFCVPASAKRKKDPLRATDAQVAWLESEIDRMNEELAPLESFVLPGGSPASAFLHLARTIVRRAERVAVELNNEAGR